MGISAYSDTFIDRHIYACPLTRYRGLSVPAIRAYVTCEAERQMGVCMYMYSDSDTIIDRPMHVL